MLEELRNLGLSGNEVKAYIALLELGPSTVLQIANKAGINRPTTYVQVESLKRRGLVGTIMKGKRVMLTPKDPVAQLGMMLEQQEQEVRTHKAVLEKLLPELGAMYTLGGNKPRVRYFEGIEGLRQMQAEFLRCQSKKIYAISSLDNVLEILPDQFESYTPRRIARGIHSKIIYTTKRGEILERNDIKHLRESRFLRPEKFSFTSDITLFDDSVAISSMETPISGTIITHKDIAGSFKALFSTMWELSEHL